MEKNELFDFSDLFKQEGKNNFDENCPILPMLAASMLIPKPFGMTWEDDVIREFLESRGYIFLVSTSEDGEEEFDVVVKKEDPAIPTEPNIIPVFEKELQRVFISFLLKNS